MKDLADDLFLLGLLSSMDAILDMSMENVLKEIAIREEIRDALLGRDNQFRRVMDVALLYETGSWDGLDEAAARLKIDSDATSRSLHRGGGLGRKHDQRSAHRRLSGTNRGG